jgi:uncharacterized protein YjeT (DUF2065 family)
VRSSATIWRFSPASVRRAMDHGADAAGLIAALRGLADGGVPQPLEYLVDDVARRHGRLRGGQVACYLRCEDEGLLAEVAADRRLRSLGLRRVAAGVLVGARPLAETLAALRANGHAPVEEAADGTAVLARVAQHRVPSPDVGIARGGPGFGGPAGFDGEVAPPPPGAVARDRDVEEIARALLAGPDRPFGRLVDLGPGIIDSALFEDYLIHPSDYPSD